jgi:hypothetical protein
VVPYLILQAVLFCNKEKITQRPLYSGKIEFNEHMFAVKSSISYNLIEVTFPRGHEIS